MSLRNSFLSIVFVLIFIGSLHADYSNALGINSVADSSKNESFNSIPNFNDAAFQYENQFNINSNHIIGHKFLIPDFNKFSFLENKYPGYNLISPQQSILMSKNQLSKALKLNYSFIKKNDLGTFGKILGAAAGVSAVGLGVYHLIKYKDDYFK